jgi:hypothetical protein
MAEGAPALRARNLGGLEVPMEREDLIRILSAWRDGVDPSSGAPLASDHPAQRTDFLRVVCAAIDALAAIAASGRANAGRPWSPSEDGLLTQAQQAGMTIAELARAHERTPGAITARPGQARPDRDAAGNEAARHASPHAGAPP